MDDTKSRHRFVRKVLITVQIQLIITTLIAMPFMLNEDVQAYALDKDHWWMRWLFLGLSMVILILIGCVESARRTFPCNVFLLLIFTIVEGLGIGFLVAAKYPKDVLIALSSTIVIVLALVLFACQVKYDFTGWIIYLFITSIVLMIVGLLVALFYRNRIVFIVIATVGLLIFAFYLVIDVQMIIGGKHKYEFDEEDWVFAAISIYIDIKEIFVYILMLVGIIGSDD